MRFGVSVALAVLLLGMPLGCVLASAPAHPCCPHHKPDTSASIKCPYDVFDSATTGNLPAPVAALPVQAAAFVPHTQNFAPTGTPIVVEDGSDLLLVNRILRI
ncbi:MAG TPA: hypothetical protein VMT15_01250 [Bryobacteraceae bacterium]|nr:hypothetical protein [Bryobacteraceae bacterium]